MPPNIAPQIQSFSQHFYRFTYNQAVLEGFTLMPMCIDIWQYPLHTVWPNTMNILNHAETERANRFYFPKHRQRFIAAHAGLRMILSRYLLDKTPDAHEFEENRYGKPSLLSHSGLEFNLSHSKDLALVVIGQHFPVGIDLEFFSGRPYLGIGSLMFSEQENQHFKRVTERLRALSFFHIWAQKEAFIKACGLGLSYPTQQFNVPHLPSPNGLVYDTLHKQDWQIVSFMPQIACSAAVCHHPTIETIRYISLDRLCDLT